MLKRVMLLAAVMTAGTMPVMAQGGPPGQPPAGGMMGPGGMAGRRMEMMMKGITLSADQQKKADSIQTAMREQMPPMTPGTPPDPEMRQKRMEMMRKQDDAIRGLLTAEQQAVWDKNAEEARAMMRRPPG
jgi:Spy/CpxP family protein refolding chaperone